MFVCMCLFVDGGFATFVSQIPPKRLIETCALQLTSSALSINQHPGISADALAGAILAAQAICMAEIK